MTTLEPVERAIAGARARLQPGELLETGDGVLYQVTNVGRQGTFTVRRATPKLRGKAARKRDKRLRRLVREHTR